MHLTPVFLEGCFTENRSNHLFPCPAGYRFVMRAVVAELIRASTRTAINRRIVKGAGCYHRACVQLSQAKRSHQ
jgi:hypothetical protein